MAHSRAWEAVLARVERDLLDGRLRVGDHLPPERALAAELQVSRSSVREAVRVLEVMGLVRTATGSGPNAGAIIVSSPSGGMTSLMRLQLAGRGFEVEDVVRTRVILETAVVEQLAHDRTDLGPSAALLDAMDSPRPRREFLALDAQFHVSLAEASGNSVVAAVMGGLRGSIERYVLEGASRVDDWPAMAERLQTEHRAVVAAIRAGDPALASRGVADHIHGYYADTNLLTLHP